MVHIFSFDLSISQLVIFGLVAVLVGLSKTGIHGAGMIAVPLLASIFGGQRSAGIMLPILCLADLFGVWYYHRHASWVHLKKLFPWAACGTVLGTYFGQMIDDHAFKIFMAAVILLSILIMLWLERGHKDDVPASKTFAAITGTAGGFTSMVGNLAGSVMAVYFLSMRLPKNEFIGTTAWFFMVMNWFKIPFHVYAWKTIDVNTIWLDVMTVPLILLGGIAGIWIVQHMAEKVYRWFILAMTVIAAFMMLY